MADLKYEITEELGEISGSTKGWRKELNLVSWSGREPKYDLRDWAPEHEKMGKGITLSKEELQALKELLNSMDI
ncbi:MAG: YdbC family protein [Clostridium sp.]